VFDGENYYKFLGVSENASSEDLRRAYHRLAIKYHPDTGSEKDDEAIKKLNFIYSILSDPGQRDAYNESIAYGHYKKRSSEQRHERHERPEEKPEDYTKAVFVNGIEAVDSEGSRQYVELGDYLYYKVKTTKKAFLFDYRGNDYFRTHVLKIYSKKRNDFRRVPIFVVKYQDVNHIIFEEEFRKFWLTENGFKILEKKKAAKTFAVGIVIIALIFYKLLNIQ